MCVRARLLPSEYRKLTQSISEKKLLCTCCQEGMGDNGFLGADFHALRVARTAISDKGLIKDWLLNTFGSTYSTP